MLGTIGAKLTTQMPTRHHHGLMQCWKYLCLENRKGNTVVKLFMVNSHLWILLGGSCGEGCIIKNEDERFMERYIATMDDLTSRYVSRFTIMQYRIMCARLLFIC